MAFRGRATGSTAESGDSDAVRRAIRLIADPVAAIEIRVLPAGKTRTFASTDLDGIAAYVASHEAYTGIYYALNPVPLGTTAKVSTVLNRRWLLIDVDPTKPADVSSTDAEHDNARSVANRIVSELFRLDWPVPVLIDSGNGWHLLYRIDLENTPLSRELIKSVLEEIGNRFDREGGAKVDRRVFDAPRIAKLPGTWARKGPHTPERPHRLCRIISAPDEPRVVTVEQLSALVKPKDQPAKPVATSNAFKGKATTDRSVNYARTAFQKELAELALAGDGNRNNKLNEAAFAAGQFVGAGALLREHVEAELLTVAERVGLPTHEAQRTIKSGLDAGVKEPRKLPETIATPTPASKPYTPGDRIIYYANEVTPRKVEWLWAGRIPLGKLTTFAGIGGLGKTFVLCDITARVTKGLPWPDGAAINEENVGKVVFVSGEDDPDDTLVPRLMQLGANLDRVVFIKTEVQDQFTLADIDTLDAVIEQAGPVVRLIVIDPPTAYLGDVDDHSNAELRGLLGPLKSWAARHRVGVIFNTHVNKGGSGKTEAMMRVMGSVAWVNAVRAAYMFARDPEDDERILFIPMKMNIARRRKGLAYRIKPLTEEPDGPATVEWLGEVETTADEAVAKETKPRRIDAVEFLEEIFAEKAELPSKEIWKAKDRTTVSKNALNEAKDELGITAHQTYDTDGTREWTWRWSSEARQRWQDQKAKNENGGYVPPESERGVRF